MVQGSRGQGPRRGPQTRRRTGSRPAGRQAKRPTAPIRRSRGTPPVVWLLLIGVPLIGILGLVSIYVSQDDPEVVVEDPNQQFRDLEQEIPAMRQECREVIRLLREEDSDAKRRSEELAGRLENWMERWDGLLEPLRDPNTDELPPEYQGYQRTRSNINTLRLDLLKASPF